MPEQTTDFAGALGGLLLRSTDPSIRLHTVWRTSDPDSIVVEMDSGESYRVTISPEATPNVSLEDVNEHRAPHPFGYVEE